MALDQGIGTQTVHEELYLDQTKNCTSFKKGITLVIAVCETVAYQTKVFLKGYKWEESVCGVWPTGKRQWILPGISQCSDIFLCPEFI